MSIVPSRNRASRPQEKQARLPGQSYRKPRDDPGINSRTHHFIDYRKRDKKEAALRAGGKLHLWQFKDWPQEYPRKIGRYRCVICDYLDTAPWPHTPDAHEPFCPAGPGMVD